MTTDLPEDQTMSFDNELDVRNLNCPLPILRTKKSLAGMTSGQILKIVATDKGSVKDMVAFANQTGNELLSSSEESGEFIFHIKKK
jgi:tRNA 2-thiouridine synthesizing protein A